MTDPHANAFERDMPGTAARNRAEGRIEGVCDLGGVFVEAVRATRLPMVLTDPTLPGDPIVFANRAFLDLSGYAMDEVLGQSPHFMNGPGTDPEDAARFEQILASDADGAIETIQLARNGRRFIANVLLSAFKDDAGQTIHHFLTWADVTGRVTAEGEAASLRTTHAALRDSEERYRTLFESMDEGYLLGEVLFDEADTATDIRFVEANPAAVRLAGRDFVGERMREIDPQYEDFWYEAYGRVALTGESMRAEHYAEPHGRWFDFCLSRVGPPQSRLVASVFQDITERKRTEQALRESEARQAFLLKLSDTLRATSGDAIIGCAIEMLAEELRLDLCYVVSVVPDEDRADVVHQLRRGADMPEVPATIRLSDFPQAFVQWQERTLVSQDIASDPTLTGTDRQNVAAMRSGALIAASVRRGAGNPMWSIVAVMAQPRRWTASEVALIEETTERTWAAIERARAEEALSASEERFRLAIEGSKIALYECDLDLRYTWIANPVEGWQPSDILGRTDDELLPPDHSGPLIDFKRRALTADAALEEELEGIPSGEPRWYLMRAEKLLDGTGSVRGLRVLALDIHEVKVVERSLRESEERLRSFGEASQDILWMRDADTLQWTYLTPAFESIYGLSREDALKGDNFRSWLDLIVPEDRDHAAREIETVRSGQQVAFEYRVQRPSDGRVSWLRETDFPISDGTGKVAWVGGIGHDVTELRESEERRRRIEERFGLIVENARDYAIFTTDCDGKIDGWYEGAAAVFGWSAEEAIGQPAEITFTPEDRAEGAAAGERHTAARDGTALDVRWHLRKDGTRIFIDGVSTALRDANGALAGFLKIGHDVTKRHAAEQRQRLLLAELQHRVRNIMAMIRSVARRTGETTDSVEDYIQHLEGRLSAMARTQVLLTREVNAAVDLQNLILDELQMQTAQPEHYTVTGPDVALPPKAAEVLGLAIHELATNAVKYGALSGGDGRVDVRWALLEGDKAPQLTLIWTELGVRMNEAPGRSGFGTELVTERVPYELQGSGTMEFRPTGLVATIEFPLADLPSILQTDDRIGGLS